MKGDGHSKNKQYTSEYIALLYQKYSHKLYCNAFLLHPKTALEVPEDEILYFLFAVLRNVMYTITKDEAKNSHFPLGYDEDINNSPDLTDSEDVFIRVIHTECIKNIFSKLKPSLRDTMIFHYCYGFKYREIADIFHISERAVKKRIATAKKQIKTMFRKEDFL